MSTRDLIELVTLVGGIVASVVGAINQIRQRRAGDADLAATAGADVLKGAKAAQDIAIPASYLDQVRELSDQLAAAQAQLRQQPVVQQPPGEGP